MVASLFAGAAVSPAMLIVARLVQGLGAAMVLPSTLSTLNAMFQGRERGVAFAIWGSTIGGMAAVGPLVGGWLATDVSWRWAFWLNIPFGLLALAGIARYIDETRDTTLRRGADVPGVLLSSLGLAGIVFGLIEGAYYGWWLRPAGGLSPVPFALAGGVALVAAFVVVEQRRVLAGKVALVDLSLLRIRSFRFGIIAALIVALGEFGLLFTLPLLLQGALGYSALGTGFLVLWLAVGTFLVSGATPQLTARIGQRAVVRVGLGLEAVAIARSRAHAQHRGARRGHRCLAVRLRRRGRHGDRPAHQRHPRRGAARRERSGVGLPDDGAPAGVRARCGAARRTARGHPDLPDLRAAGRLRPAAGPA